MFGGQVRATKKGVRLEEPPEPLIGLRGGYKNFCGNWLVGR